MTERDEFQLNIKLININVIIINIAHIRLNTMEHGKQIQNVR